MDHKAISQEIFRQLGGGRFTVMTGASSFTFSESEPKGNLTFRVPATATKNRINYIKIVLEPDDTYTVTYYAIRGTKIKTVRECTQVYCDTLQSNFTETTGLYTSL